MELNGIKLKYLDWNEGDLQVFLQRVPEVPRDNIIPFNEYNILTPSVLGCKVPEIINRKQFDFFLNNLVLK